MVYVKQVALHVICSAFGISVLQELVPTAKKKIVGKQAHNCMAFNTEPIEQSPSPMYST